MSVDDLAHRLQPDGEGTPLPPAEISRQFGRDRLPADYLAFVSRFPPGEFDNELLVLHPQTLDEQRPVVEDLVAFFGNGFNAPLPFSFGGNDGQLLIWGYVNIVGLMTWRVTGGDPDQWPVVVVTDEHDWQEFSFGMVDFLLTVVLGSEPMSVGYLPLQAEGRYIRHGAPVVPTRIDVPLPWDVVPEPVGVRDETERIAQILDRHLADVVPEVDQNIGTVGVRTIVPDDYRWLVTRIGPGRFGSIQVVAPNRLDRFGRKVYDHVAMRRPLGRSVADFAFVPEGGGAIPWGEAADGWVLAWIPVGSDPNTWPIIAIDPNWGLVRHSGLSITGFIAAYLQGEPSTVFWTRTDQDRPAFTRM